ncbi:coenzyme PQQ synthesis protein D (PqqD) [Herbihabitans rhizosphaerae]|uniref:Coenzyme PQQ synthesis protein D (PqqD) n=1 Tax=Herbihabitans rhizosphaerae TaxID=1872711 RepID=A0A4Q7KFY5_9PSEU|nr:lasso peptide biosynthesis PqqD family chaperone [Herbihabitans rhizosphaerae]RZS33979.1 coenzyme PQQ synthesis protein D (PqqD) [Herbihabitans rhizosphaerae]
MTIALSPHVLATETEGGLVLLDERAGKYWQLNGSGATTLRLLLDGRSAEQVADELTKGDPGAVPRAVADVRALVDSLRAARLVVAS